VPPGGFDISSADPLLPDERAVHDTRGTHVLGRDPSYQNRHRTRV
jgi:hypothetical protein